MSNDIADGVFDGKNLTNIITLCGSAMIADTGTTQYHNAITGVSPSLFGLSVANADFTSAQNASIGKDTTSTSANNLVINNANAESVATAVFALLNLQAGQVPSFSLNNQQAIGANTYLLSGTCTTNGSISETIYDNNGSQALDIGDRFNLSLSNCDYLQDVSTPSSRLIKTGSQDATIVSNTNVSGTMNMNEQWGSNKSRSYQMTGLLPFLVQGQTPPTYSTTAISSLSLSQDGYNLASDGLSVAYSSTTGLFMNGDIVSTNSPNNGRFSIITPAPLSGLDFNCFSAGTVVIGGATTNMHINFSHSGSYTLGLDTNKDGIVDETLTGTQTCPVSLSLLK